VKEPPIYFVHTLTLPAVDFLSTWATNYITEQLNCVPHCTFNNT